MLSLVLPSVLREAFDTATTLTETFKSYLPLLRVRCVSVCKHWAGWSTGPGKRELGLPLLRISLDSILKAQAAVGIYALHN